jgi:hypothetical protein
MGKATADASAGKMFSENTVAVLLMSMGSTSITVSQYEMMSALDGEKTASSFQHQFRSVVKKAKELKSQLDDGGNLKPVPPSAKKRGKCRVAGCTTCLNIAYSYLPCIGANALDDDQTPTPKKAKTTPKPKPRAKKAKATDESPFQSPNNDIGGGYDFKDDDLNESESKVKIEQSFEDEM